MSIGETLAEARRGAGLTVTEVSQRTRIRETLVKNIERDDYSGCGGDFYTRGHIRAIARVVGTDPEPLIDEYDSARREESAVTTAEAPTRVAPAASRVPRQPPAEHTPASQGFPMAGLGGWQEGREPAAGRAPQWLTPIRIRRRRNWPVLFGVALVVVVGLLGYYFVAGLGRSPAHHARMVVVSLTAVRASLVEFTTPGGRYLFRADVPAGASKRWAFRYPVDLRLADPAGVRLVVDGKNPLPRGSAARPVTLTLSPGRPVTVASPASTPAPATTSSPAVPLTTSLPLTPSSATAFGVAGPGQGDNPQLARLAIDGSRATAWTTDWYTSARFGNLYAGTGLLLDMGRPVTITGAQISLGSAPGASFQLRVGSAPALADLPPVAHATGASGVVRVRLSTPAHGRYVLIWFTRLPLTPDGNFQASVHNVRLEGRV